MSDDELDYDVVLDVLQKHYDKIDEMDKGDCFNGIMTQIRFKQCHELKTAIRMWKEYKIQKGNNND